MRGNDFVPKSFFKIQMRQNILQTTLWHFPTTLFWGNCMFW